MKILSIVAMSAMVLTGFARAADQAAATADPVPNTNPIVPGTPPVPPTENEMTVGAPAEVFGKVIGMHSCTLVGVADPHLLVKLESAPGDVDIVDLGSTAELKANGIEPKEGQTFWVDGRVGKVNGKPLVVAETVSESKLVTINHQALRVETTKHADARQADGNAAPNPAQAPAQDKGPNVPKTETVDAGQDIRTIDGVVLHSRHVRIEGESFEHVMAKVQTDNGVVVLDLGTCSALPASVDLTVGKSIAASGYVGRLNGKPIIMAESVGNLTSIERPHQADVTPSNASYPDANQKR